MTTAPLDTAQPDIDTDLDDAFNALTGHQPVEDDGADKDRFSHYVKKEDIIRANETGTPVRALCGKQWTPRRNPEKYPICPMCKEIHESIPDDND